MSQANPLRPDAGASLAATSTHSVSQESRDTCLLLSTRTCVDQVLDQPHTELLEPVNLRLNIKRNLAASWFKKMAAMEIDGDLKPMKVGRGGVCVCVCVIFLLV